MITELPRLVPARPDRPERGSADHPMRAVTRQVAFAPGGWTPERRAKVAELFDSLAPEWHTRDTPGREEPLLDALARGLDAVGRPSTEPAGPCLELGSGTGFTTPTLVERFTNVVAVDLAWEMLLRAPAEVAPRVQADAARLPFRNGSATAIVLVNALLFPDEVDRALAPVGVVVWVNTSGDRTPIYLSVADVAEALPGSWDGVAAEAGWGTWGVLVRA